MTYVSISITHSFSSQVMAEKQKYQKERISSIKSD